MQHIKAGEGIIASNQSANRDEEVFPDPDTFNMHRKRGTEEALGYGWGPHRCVAEYLARTELEIVFGEFLPFRSVLAFRRGEARRGMILNHLSHPLLTATLFQKLPNLKLAIPESEIKYSPPKKDVGIAELLVVF